MWLLYHSADPLQFESGHVKPVPVSLIAVYIKNGKIYADIKTVSALTSNSTYNLNMHEYTDVEFKSTDAELNIKNTTDPFLYPEEIGGVFIFLL
jgi:hypothetical protein